jgi:hypothetical protein
MTHPLGEEHTAELAPQDIQTPTATDSGTPPDWSPPETLSCQLPVLARVGHPRLVATFPCYGLEPAPDSM